MTPAYSIKGMPTINRFFSSDAFIRGLQGPLGSGKSSACVWEIAQRGVMQTPGLDGVRRSRWVVIRNSYKQLEDTTEKTFLQWFPPHIHGSWVPSRHVYTLRSLRAAANEPASEIEVLFRALDRPDQVKSLLSLELTGGWINEAREVPWAIVDGLSGRVGRYPAKNQNGGASWSGIFMDTNPPDTDSDWYRFFEERRGHAEAIAALAEVIPGMTMDKFAAIFRQPSGLSTKAENLGNLPAGYYQRLAVGKAEDWIKVHIRGEYGFSVDGKPVFPEYYDETHCPADPKRQPRLIPDMEVVRSWDFGLCYSDDTEVLTASGWKLFKDVDETTDLAATRDPLTGRMEYTRINFKKAEPFKGELLHWSSTELDMMVTPEHRVPYTHRDHPGEVRWASAQWLSENLGRHHMVDLTSKWDAPQFDHDQRWFGCDSGTWAAFLGIYLAEGSTTNRGQISIYQNARHTDIQQILDATGWDWRWSDGSGKGGVWRLYNIILADRLKRLGVAASKRVPAEVKGMPTEQIRKFIAAYTIGDGHVRTRSNGSVEHTIFTASCGMAADMQELAQKAGWNSSMRIVPPQVSYIVEGATVRAITGSGGFCITFKKRATRAELHRRNFRRVPYDGIVYCLNVPHHTLYVRRNGKPHWNGNTPAVVFSQVDAYGRWNILDELVATSMGADKFSDEVLDWSARYFDGCHFVDVGDPAGMQRSQADEKTCFQILHGKGIMIEAAPQTLALRLEGTRRPLRMMVEGRPQFCLHERCKVLRRAMLGGYHYRRMRVSGEQYTSQPAKNSYSHVADACTYAGAWLFGNQVRGLMQAEGDGMPWRGAGLGLADPTRNPITGY